MIIEHSVDVIKKEADSFLLAQKVSGTILFCMVTGSCAYNVANENSDIDYLGVYLFDSKEYLSFNHALPKDPLSTLPGCEIDFTLYEVKQFAQLLVKGNPFCVEACFAHNFCYVTDGWDQMREMRKTLLTKRTVEQYISYCQNQTKIFRSKPNRPGKRVYHILRLLYEAKRIVDGLEPIVWFPEGPERDELVKIRKEERTREETDQMINDLLEYIQSKQPWNNLPDEPDSKILEDWVIAARRENLKQSVMPK
jgi:predicted nucleotidyltransferase